jgi:hypothetical protein
VNTCITIGVCHNLSRTWLKGLDEACLFLKTQAAETRVMAGGTITLHRMKGASVSSIC